MYFKGYVLSFLLGKYRGVEQLGPMVGIYLTLYFSNVFKKILFSETGERRKKERERNINVWLLVTGPLLGIGQQPRHVP